MRRLARTLGLILLTGWVCAPHGWGASPTTIYRSVGPGNTAWLAPTAVPFIFSLVSGTATFTQALADNIGVGDVIQYDTGGDGIVDSLAVITGRTDSQHYSVTAPNGGAAPNATNTTVWQIGRAYTSLANAANRTPNPSLALPLESGSGGRNLVTNNEVWVVACYSDNQDQTPADWPATWVTDASHVIKLYTPYLPAEVGVSQRHNGTWTGSAYRLYLPSSGTNLSLHANNVVIEGLQFRITNLTGSGTNAVFFQGTAGDYLVSKCFFWGDSANTTGNWNLGFEVESGVGAGTLRAWNNIFYGYKGASSCAAMETANAAYAVYFYGNTIVNCNEGIINSSGNIAVKDVLLQNTSDYGFGGSYAASSDCNLSDHADAPGTHSVQSTSVAFVNAGAQDFHLSAGDTQAQRAGMDLSSNLGYLYFGDDIDNQTRTVAWDIGADEVSLTVDTPTVTPSTTLTPSPTPTNTPNIGSATSTPTRTRTSTVSPTPTRTATRTRSPTPYLSHTATVTVTPTSTPSPTITVSPTISPTATISPTFTISPTMLPVTGRDVVAYPQPASGTRVYFWYTLDAPARVGFEIFNLAGERVAAWEENQAASGSAHSAWDIGQVAPGVYLYRVKIHSSGKERTTDLKKLIVVKPGRVR